MKATILLPMRVYATFGCLRFVKKKFQIHQANTIFELLCGTGSIVSREGLNVSVIILLTLLVFRCWAAVPLSCKIAIFHVFR